VSQVEGAYPRPDVPIVVPAHCGLPNELAGDRFDGTPACPTRQPAVVFHRTDQGAVE
jgi:hypothetical protein